MNPQKSLLYSKYIIDGIPQELTPSEILFGEGSRTESLYEPVMDESVDPKIGTSSYDLWKLKEYMADLSAKAPAGTDIDIPYAGRYSKIRVARALIDAIWRGGHFRLGDLSLCADWVWNPRPVGAAAGFYSSCGAVAEYSDALGVSLSGCTAREGEGASLELAIGMGPCESDGFADESCHAVWPSLEEGPTVGGTLVPDPDSWLIYIPFDGCQPGLGGSLLTRVFGNCGDVAPDLSDPDYFIDCFEVVREMVEDNVLLSGVTVSDGGLAMALQRLAGTSRTGVSVNLRTLMKSYGEDDAVRVLFSEVPGVVVQVNDNDYDYIDAEFTLQDVAFFPLGHPTPSRPGLKVDISDKDSINRILESLIRSQSSEGED